MEFDNDRIIRHKNKIEVFYWVLAALLYPLVNIFTLFTNNFTAAIFVALAAVIVLPLYITCSVWVLPVFLQKRKVWLLLSGVAIFIAAHLLLMLLYYFFRQVQTDESQSDYFIYATSTFLRESLWIIINLALAAGIFLLRKTMTEKDVAAALRKENNFYKLRYLRAQLNPHFLFNALNSIYSLSLQKSDNAPGAVIRLADVMRYLIYECNEEHIPLSKEIDFIKNYIEIEKIRFNADVKFTVEGGTEGILIEPFLFISFIENGFKHAMNNPEIKPFIYITIKVREEEIVLNVINNTDIDLETQAKRINGKGISGSKSLLELLYPSAYKLNIIQTNKDERQESKVRLKNAKERLESFYPDAHTLDVILKNNVFTVSLIIKRKAA
ncbi:histidine kinase [Panacibacter sp. DH6]|uniref:Histidine kinase n=1 Tax=Panacibacter microcysteis TaxID=2793269 RepID=A0A931E2Z4_9BACT|nr:sensor histidine kinase [Panacibacter microcysteis]MBG9376650.1 histidine kinase [Panacibacter microcysteis]